MARETGLEPATSGVTGRRSNQLSYSPAAACCAREGPNMPCVLRSQGEERNALEQAPKKLIDFFDKSLLQHFDFERFLIVRTIPFERKALTR